jgi:hypothetical protein
MLREEEWPRPDSKIEATTTNESSETMKPSVSTTAGEVAALVGGKRPHLKQQPVDLFLKLAKDLKIERTIIDVLGWNLNSGKAFGGRNASEGLAVVGP